MVREPAVGNADERSEQRSIDGSEVDSLCDVDGTRTSYGW